MATDLIMEPFNKFYMLNFNDLVKIDTDIEDEILRRLWHCDWQPAKFERMVNAWTNERASVESQLHDAAALKNLLCAALEMSCLFIQVNFTGPPLAEIEQYKEILNKTTANKFEPFVKLMESGEEVNPNVELGELLVMAKEILDVLLKKSPNSFVLCWWKMRLLCLQQQLLDELTGSLWEQIKNLLESLLPNARILQDNELEALLHCECANAYLQFRSTRTADLVLQKLREQMDINLTVEGLMGMRTRFQQKPLPQLCLKVNQKQPARLPTAVDTNGSINLPRLLLHEDDTRLERILFVDEADNEVMTLPAVLQVYVLSTVKYLQRSQPKDLLADEQLEPYLQTLIYQANGPWAVRQTALLLQCVQECNQRRTIERSWKQCEECLRMIGDTQFPLAARLSYGFASYLQPRWAVERQHCGLLLSLGMVKSALDLFLRIQSWEDVIFCYTRLEMRHKAKEYIEQELAKRPTALLYILLGEATDDPKWYEHAWEFSGERSSRAQAYWGHFYFLRGDYPNAIEHYQKSVAINTLQENVWLRLGFSAIKTEQWQLAVRAYITYTHLEPLGFESWNNLAKALIKLGDKERAHKMLGEALKCNFGNWKVWENYLLVSIDTQHYEDAINAYTRLAELKDRYIDLEALCFIVNAIVMSKSDAGGQTTERLRKKAITLLGHECIRHKDEPKMWELAAALAATPLNKAQKLVKAFNALTARELNWPFMEPFALRALNLCHEVCALSLEATRNHSEDESILLINSQLNTARLTAQSCIRAVEKNTEKWPANEAMLEKVKHLHDQLIVAIETRKALLAAGNSG